MAELEIEVLPALSDNYVYLLWEPESGVSGVVDPAQAAPVLARLGELGRGLDWILSTHHHFDHTGGNLDLKSATGCSVVGPSAERDRIPGLDLAVGEGDVFELGRAAARVIETPGHTSGHISYWFEESSALFCADALFALGCGRVFEGTPAQMWASLAKLRELPDETRVYCGHEYTQSNAAFAVTVDPGNELLQQRAAEVARLRAEAKPTIPSRLAVEKATNPFLRPDDDAIRSHLGMEGAADSEVFAEIRRRKDSF